VKISERIGALQPRGYETEPMDYKRTPTPDLSPPSDVNELSHHQHKNKCHSFVQQGEPIANVKTLAKHKAEKIYKHKIQEY